MFKEADIVLFDAAKRALLYPFTQTRSVADIRFGILTAKERWEYIAGKKVAAITENYLNNNVKTYISANTLFIDAAILPDNGLLKMLNELQHDEVIEHKKNLIAFWAAVKQFGEVEKFDVSTYDKLTTLYADVISVRYPWHLVQYNEAAIRFDFQLLTKGKTSKPISATNKIISPENVFIEEGAVIEHSIINAAAGPVYIGRNATVMEGCLIRGPFALGESAVLKMGTVIYGATTIGPFCTAGGEIKNSIMMGYSNKAHYGYLGDSVIGEWCNIGAGTSTSNIKNDAGNIVVATFEEKEHIDIGLKCGTMMGDYTRTAINTSLNSATFAGVACNIFGEGLTPKHIPNFTWGHNGSYIFEKALQHIDNWKKLKHQKLTNREIDILKHLHKTTIQ
jgi:UDP-N-acetylglucosamine diphosphorylase/glucosamine-1-phosphate N-acetyltransferase